MQHIQEISVSLLQLRGISEGKYPACLYRRQRAADITGLRTSVGSCTMTSGQMNLNN